jgi:ribosomal protein L21
MFGRARVSDLARVSRRIIAGAGNRVVGNVSSATHGVWGRTERAGDALRSLAVRHLGAGWERARDIGVPLCAHSFSTVGDASGDDGVDVFGVVRIGASQYKVSPDDLIFVERWADRKDNDQVRGARALNQTQTFSLRAYMAHRRFYLTHIAPHAHHSWQVVFPDVLMVGSRSCTVIGRPSVPNAEVHAVVEEHVRDAKKLAFKKKRRKGYQRLKGHRQQLTGLRISRVTGLDAAS